MQLSFQTLGLWTSMDYDYLGTMIPVLLLTTKSLQNWVAEVMKPVPSCGCESENTDQSAESEHSINLPSALQNMCHINNLFTEKGLNSCSFDLITECSIWDQWDLHADGKSDLQIQKIKQNKSCTHWISHIMFALEPSERISASDIISSFNPSVFQ